MKLRRRLPGLSYTPKLRIDIHLIKDLSKVYSNFEENREDSINFENNRLKPTHFIKKVSSKCYAFAYPDIYSNLQACGFIKERTSESGYNSSTYDEFGYDVYCRIQTDYNRNTKEGNSNINIIQYNFLQKQSMGPSTVD